MSKSVSLEDLKEKNNHLETEVVKLSGEVEKLSKDVQEVLKRQEDSSKAVEDKIGNLGLLMERTLRQISNKSLIPGNGESRNANRLNGDNHSRNHGKGNNFGRDEEGLDPDFHMSSEEINWTNSTVKERNRIVKNVNNMRGNNVQLPRMDFPRFDGGDPKMWRTNCKFYFEMFDVSDLYKTKMAVMNFTEELHEWYRCTFLGTPVVPWEMLADEVMDRFQTPNIKHPVNEFKRTHQIGRVDEFIKRFDRVRARLMLERPALDEEFFVAGFVSGLKEEVRHTVELFNLKGC